MIWIIIIVAVIYFLSKSNSESKYDSASTIKTNSISTRNLGSESTHLKNQCNKPNEVTNIDPNYTPIVDNVDWRNEDEKYYFVAIYDFDDDDDTLCTKPRALVNKVADSILRAEQVRYFYIYNNYIYFWFSKRKQLFYSTYEVFRGHEFSFVRMRTDCTDKSVLLENCSFIIEDRLSDKPFKWLYFIQYKPSVKIYRFNITKKELVIDPYTTNKIIVDNYTFSTKYDENNQPIEITIDYVVDNGDAWTIHVPFKYQGRYHHNVDIKYHFEK